MKINGGRGVLTSSKSSFEWTFSVIGGHFEQQQQQQHLLFKHGRFKANIAYGAV